MGSIRPRPVYERHGIRQKADALPTKASARAAACDLIVTARLEDADMLMLWSVQRLVPSCGVEGVKVLRGFHVVAVRT